MIQKIKKLLTNRATIFISEKWLFYNTLRKYENIKLPSTIIIDPSTICNLKCPLCPVGNKTGNLTKKLMSYELFKKIIDELNTVKKIHLYSAGEPFFNKDIFTMIEYAHKKDIFVSISSNLNHFNEIMAYNVVNSGLDELIVCIDGATQKIYEIYRKGGDIEKVLSNIYAINKIKFKQKRRNPKLILKFLVSSYNIHQLEDAQKLAKKYSMLFEYSKLNIRDSDKEFIWIPKSQKYSKYDLKTRKLLDKSVCIGAWTCPTISSDGKVYPCCVIYDPKYAFGDITNEQFIDIWNNRMFGNIRKAIINRSAMSKELPCIDCFVAEQSRNKVVK